jgi:hypothetical protein
MQRVASGGLLVISLMTVIAVLTIAGCHNKSRIRHDSQGEWYAWSAGRGAALQGWCLKLDDRTASLGIIEWDLCRNKIQRWGSLPGVADHIDNNDWRIKFSNRSTMLLDFGMQSIASTYDDRIGSNVHAFLFERNELSLGAARALWEDLMGDDIEDLCSE